MRSLTHFLILTILSCLGRTAYAAKTDTVRIGSFIKIHKISPNVYRYIAGNGDIPSNGLIYVDNGEALMIDAPLGDGITDSLLAWVPRALGAHIKAVVVTHWHLQDRMGGIDAVIAAHIPSYCNQQTIVTATQKNLLHPVTGFNDSLTLTIGRKQVHCVFPGKGHTADNIVVWMPEERILFGGCMVKDRTATSLGYTADADFKSWPVSIHNLLKLYPQAKIIVPGHMDYGGKELLYHTLDLLKKR